MVPCPCPHVVCTARHNIETHHPQSWSLLLSWSLSCVVCIFQFFFFKEVNVPYYFWPSVFSIISPYEWVFLQSISTSVKGRWSFQQWTSHSFCLHVNIISKLSWAIMLYMGRCLLIGSKELIWIVSSVSSFSSWTSFRYIC